MEIVEGPEAVIKRSIPLKALEKAEVHAPHPHGLHVQAQSSPEYIALTDYLAISDQLEVVNWVLSLFLTN